MRSRLHALWTSYPDLFVSLRARLVLSLLAALGRDRPSNSAAMSAVFPPVTGSVPACVTSVKVGAQTYSFPWLSAMTCMAGPVTIALSICAEYQNLYYAEIGYSGHAARGAYNNACDREIIWLGAGVKI